MIGNSAARAVISGALVAGTLDAIFAVIAYVFVLRAFSIVGVLQYIASGLVGKAAFSWGLPAAALGVGIHYFLAFAFATIFFIAWRRFAIVRRRAIASGLIYGAGVWLLMDFIVLPLTGTPKFPFNAAVFVCFMLDHMFFVGLPIALAVRRYSP